LLASLGNGLDGWARSWSAMYRNACEATRVRGEQSDELLDLRMQCLSQHLIEARAVVDQLALADRGLVERADRVLAGLAPLDRCAKPAQLRAQDPEPTTPEGAAALAHLREAHAVARTLTLVQPAKAGPALDPLLAEARKLGFRPLLSEVLITAGDEARYRGAREQAEASLQEAALQASLSGRHDLAGRALGTLIELNGYAGKLDEALHYSDLARAEIERSGDLGDDEASRLKGIGRVLALYGRFDAALPALQRAVALREKRGDWQGLSDALCALAEGLGRAGRGREGLDIGRRCVSLVEQELGPVHPRVALALNLGLLFSLSALGETDEEEKVLRRVVEIEERSLPSDHWQLGLHLNNLGEALRKQGRCGEALAPLERAVAIAERRLPSSAVVVATMLGNLGACLVDLGRAAQARAHLERAKELAGSVTSAPPEVLSDVRFHLARALWDSGGSRSAARALATEARRGFADLPERRMDLAEADHWLAEH
jgi:tetratricopeptide (TPR) repeat protein